MTCGHRHQDIDSIPFPAALEQMNYWAEHPPVHISVAAFLGIKSNRQAESHPGDGHVKHMRSMAGTHSFSALPRSVREFVKATMKDKANAS